MSTTTRLRRGFGGLVPPVCDEAANEIDRLKAELDIASEGLTAAYFHGMADAKEEIDRLKAKLAGWPDLFDDNMRLQTQLSEARAEIEQYKGCLQLLSSIWYHGDFVVETYNEARLCELMKLLGFWPYKEEFKLEG